jgi:hypothetical protein
MLMMIQLRLLVPLEALNRVEEDQDESLETTEENIVPRQEEHTSMYVVNVGRMELLQRTKEFCNPDPPDH